MLGYPSSCPSTSATSCQFVFSALSAAPCPSVCGVLRLRCEDASSWCHHRQNQSLPLFCSLKSYCLVVCMSEITPALELTGLRYDCCHTGCNSWERGSVLFKAAAFFPRPSWSCCQQRRYLLDSRCTVVRAKWTSAPNGAPAHWAHHSQKSSWPALSWLLSLTKLPTAGPINR